MEKEQKTFTLLLTNLHCYLVEEHGYDDVYLKYNGKKIWPEGKKRAISMDTTTVLNIPLKNLSDKQQLVIELWDWDLISANDKLGTFTLQVEGSPGSFSTDMVQNKKETRKAKYTLIWEVL